MTKPIHICNLCGHCDINDKYELWSLRKEAVEFLLHTGEIEIENDDALYDFHVCDKCAKKLAKKYPKNFEYVSNKYEEYFTFSE